MDCRKPGGTDGAGNARTTTLFYCSFCPINAVAVRRKHGTKKKKNVFYKLCVNIGCPEPSVKKTKKKKNRKTELPGDRNKYTRYPKAH